MFSRGDYVLFKDSFGECQGKITQVHTPSGGVQAYEMTRPGSPGSTIYVYEDELTLLAPAARL